MVIIKMQVNGQKLVIVEEESQAEDSQENVGSDGDERNQSDYSGQGF